MQVPDADLIVAVRGIRKLVVTLDSIGFPLQDLLKDDELRNIIPKDIAKKVNAVASGAHTTLQKIEHSKRYRDAVYKLCSVSERRVFILDGEKDG